MTFNREKFAADIYLRLLESYPAKTEEWRQDEAIRQADAFASKLESKQPKKYKRKEYVNV